MSVKKRLTILTFVALLLANVFILVPGNVTAASKVDELKNKYAALEKKQESIKKEIDAAKKDAKKYSQLVDALQKQTKNTLEQISVLEDSIKTLDLSIAEKERDISEKQGQINANYDLLKQRLRALYMAGDVSTLEILISAVDFGDFLEKAEFVRQITKHDRDLIEQLESDLVMIKESKKEIEKNRSDLNSNKVLLNIKKSQLVEQKEESEKALKNATDDQQAKEKQKKQIDKELDALEKEIDKILREEMSKGSQYVGGEFTWPVPGYYHISSPYGMRWGRLHGGIDIATGSNRTNIHGKDIVAANSGTVISVLDKGNASYGKYLIIDHGGGVATLYAHCSSIVVKKGQKVARGQVVAKVGSTGNSTGPHLHFEIRINGNRIDPMTKFKKL